jgi:sterol 3beta-glucosyltransferase
VSRIGIVSIGTRGDVAPMTGVAGRLRDAGHDVIVAAHGMFAELVRGCGLRFRPLDPETETTSADVAAAMESMSGNPVKLLAAAVGPNGMRRMAEGVLAALADEPMDLLLMSPVAELAGLQLAEAKGIPSIGLRLQPLSTTAAYPPSVLGGWSAGGLGNHLAGRLGTATVDRLYAGVIADLRRRLDLPPISARALRRRRTETHWPIQYGYSPTVLPRPADWRPGIDVVGYWFPARPADWRPPEELVRFLDDGPPPVFIGFGSLTMTKAASARLSELVPKALRAAGLRGVLQAGWAGLAGSGPDLITIGEVPHDWLFERVAAVVHACGAGTTAAGLRTGVPALGVPGPVGDQRFWARRLRQLGVSPATLSLRTLTEDRLAAALRDACADEPRAAAGRVAAGIAAEDGPGAVLKQVESLLR